MKQIPVFIDGNQPEKGRKCWFVTYNVKEYGKGKEDFVTSRLSVKFDNFLKADEFAKEIKEKVKLLGTAGNKKNETEL